MLKYFGKAKHAPVLYFLSYYILGILLGKMQLCFSFVFLILAAGLLALNAFRFFRAKYKGLILIALAMAFIWLGAFQINCRLEYVKGDTGFDISFPRRVAGRILDYPKRTKHRTTFDMLVTDVRDSSDGRPQGEIIKTSVLESSSEFTRGQSVSCLLRLDSYDSAHFFGRGFNIRKYQKRAFYRGLLKAAFEVEKLEVKGFIRRMLVGSRMRIQGEIKKAGKFEGVLGGLLLGDKKNIPPEVKKSFRAAGLSHILVISGFHVGLVFAFFFSVFRFFLKRWHSGMIRFDISLLCSFGALAFCIFYVMITGLPYPTLRAILMILFGVVCMVLNRPVISLNVLMLVSLLILLFDPLALFSVSFELSFAAVLGIIYGFSKIRPLCKSFIAGKFSVRERRARVLLFISDLALVTILATLFTLPVSVYYFEKFSTIGILANLIFVPVFSFVILPLGFCSMALTLFSAALGSMFFKIEFVLIGSLNYLISYVGKLPFALIDSRRIYFEDVAIYYLLIFMVINLRKKPLHIASTILVACSLIVKLALF